MNLALEIPTQLLPDIQPLCNYGFALAQNVLEDETYRAFYLSLSHSGVPIILDNGLHELAKPLSIGELEAAVEMIKPTWVIAPDYRKDSKATYDAFSQMQRRLTGHSTKVGVVLQAKDLLDLSYLYNSVRHASLLCFPYRENRMEWMSELLTKYPPTTNAWAPYIHCMGVSSYEDLAWWSDVEKAHHFHISVDTAKPIKWGILGQRLKYGTSMRGAGVDSSTLHRQKNLSEKQLMTMYWNIAYLKKFL